MFKLFYRIVSYRTRMATVGVKGLKQKENYATEMWLNEKSYRSYHNRVV